jgi:hypothetical protein
MQARADIRTKILLLQFEELKLKRVDCPSVAEVEKRAQINAEINRLRRVSKDIRFL